MIAQAPWAFAVWTFVIAGVVWGVVNHLKANRIEALDGRLKLRDDEISDYKRKLSGATPEEAKARIDALELAVARLGPRRLTADQITAITAAARVSPGVAAVSYDMAFAAGQGLAGQLQRALKDAGWAVTGGIVGGPSFLPAEGIAINIHSEQERTSSEKALISAFRAADLRFAVQPVQPWPSQPEPIRIILTNPAD